MAKTETNGSRIGAICTCVPSERFDNLNDAKEFTQEEIRKVTAMAGIAARRVADESTCSSDLCEVAANRVLEMTGWKRNSIDALIMVTQSPDYFTPSTACLLQKRLDLSEQCAAIEETSRSLGSVDHRVDPKDLTQQETKLPFKRSEL
jgi:3-oxoacyl-[acyl-carrier-protein] synthase-3